MWENLYQTYSRARDAAQLYELKLKMMTMRQMKKSVTEYTHEVRTLWQEFDQYKIADMTDPFDAALYREEIERDRTYEYLVELNSEYDQVRIQILGREKLPPLNEVISLVRGEESCRNLMLGSQNVENSIFMTKNGKHYGNNSAKTKGEPSGQERTSDNDFRNKLRCTYYKKARHTIDRCYKLHGRPQSHEWVQKRGQQKSENQAHISVVQQGEVNTSAAIEEVPQAQVLQASCSSNYSSNNRKITTAVGSSIIVAGIGNICLSPYITLKNVLHVLMLTTNLISMSGRTIGRCLIPFFHVHSDVWGPAPTPSTSGARWFITFIDDCTRMTWIYLLKNKSEVSMALIQFFSLIRTQFETTIQRFRSDNAKDYFNHTLTSYFQKEGIVHESSYVYTPQQNGVAKWKNGHLLGMTKALIIQNNVPKYFWGEGVPMAAHLINRLPTKSLNFKSSIDMLSFFYPHILLKTNLIPRIFGCTAFVHIHEQYRDKLDPRALKCIFVGYSQTQKGYCCYYPPTKKFFISRDVTFNEKKHTITYQIIMIKFKC
ncbi:unnamed protein product [Spirodela intermedia]|uniref:Integrase catalytic domain-containing protein n=1 Tax=Spirodela intermedia TaxID=51605 RepID=A0A7I8J5F1_SPIIN|nr:unnamed protein product [Spirodela intermedia]CAA6665274.1 unnamed protein product [Spirodela intermedia]